MTRSTTFRVLFAAIAATLPGVSRPQGQVVLDNFTIGNLADDVSLSPDASDTFNITENLGQRAGNNLFHSFKAFDIDTGETALFSGNTAITNIVSRVTGGDATQIDGTIRSTIDGADFWFVNPAGVIFGANSRIDVGGTFNIGAAEFIVSADDILYSTLDDSISLSVESPQSFGFLAPGSGGELRLGPDLSDPASSPASPGVRFGPDDDRYSGLWFAGEEVISSNGSISSQTGLDAGGNVKITGERITLTGTSISSVTHGGTDAGEITVYADNLLSVGGDSRLTSTTTGSGNAGIIDLRAATIGLTDAVVSSASTADESGVPGASGAAGAIFILATELVQIANTSIRTDTNSTTATIVPDDMGNDAVLVGSIDIEAGDGDIKLLQSTLSSLTAGASAAGVIELKASSITVIGDGDDNTIELQTSTSGAGGAGRISLLGADTIVLDMANIESSGKGTDSGLAGIVQLYARDTVSLNDSTIRTNTNSDASVDSWSSDEIPGSIEIAATGANDGNGALSFANSTLSAATSGAGNAGIIDLRGVTIHLDGTTVASTSDNETFDSGAAGFIQLLGTESIDLTDSSLTTNTSSDATGDLSGLTTIASGGDVRLVDTAVEASTSGASPAGLVEIFGANILLLRTIVEARTAGPGEAGGIVIANDPDFAVTEEYAPGLLDFFLDGVAKFQATPETSVTLDATGILAESVSDGEGGDIVVNAGSLRLSNGSALSTAAVGSGDSGFIDVEVTGNLIISGTPDFFSGITTRAAIGQGGDIAVTAGGGLDMDVGIIEASAGEVSGDYGDSGNIEVKADNVKMRSSGIFARAVDGEGGAIKLTISGVEQLFVIDTESRINADSDTGNAGQIDVNVPDVDLDSGLQEQDANIVAAPELAADSCSPSNTGARSTFAREDEGGTPESPDRYLIANAPTISNGETVQIADRAGASAVAQLAALSIDPREACR